MRIATPVNLIILNKKGQVLLARRNENEDQFVGCWSIPGGGPEEGESYEDALKREVEEEIGCKIIKAAFFRSYYFKLNPELHVRSVYFYGTIRGDVKLNDELCEFGWFSINDALKLKLAFNQRDVLRDFRKVMIVR